MATSRQPATKRQRALEQLLPRVSSDIWPASPAFDPQRVLLKHLFFISSDRTKYLSVGFYPARDYQPMVEFHAILRSGSKSIVLKDEHIDPLAECLPKFLLKHIGPQILPPKVGIKIVKALLGS